MDQIIQTLYGTLFTWSMTTLGAFGCLLNIQHISNCKLLDCSLGFSAGVMLAASFWSLLIPAEELAKQSGYGAFSFLPLLIGMVLGTTFVILADDFVPMESMCHSIVGENKCKFEESENPVVDTELGIDGVEIRKRRNNESLTSQTSSQNNSNTPIMVGRRLFLMMVAITIHNIPEGMAVGVGYGGISSSKATKLTLAIGLQNIPEGLAVALPLRAAGLSFTKSIWYGQLSGLVEIPSGILGCLLVEIAKPILPYALAFAAGTMIFVIFDDVIPETTNRNNGRLASIWGMIGFCIMMSMDMGLG